MTIDHDTAAAWISDKARWAIPADSADPFVVRVAVGYAGAEIMASGSRTWRDDLAQLKEYAALFGMDDAMVSAEIDKAALTLMGG
jgi:hypothetical protein